MAAAAPGTRSAYSVEVRSTYRLASGKLRRSTRGTITLTLRGKRAELRYDLTTRWPGHPRSDHSKARVPGHVTARGRGGRLSITLCPPPGPVLASNYRGPCSVRLQCRVSSVRLASPARQRASRQRQQPLRARISVLRCTGAPGVFRDATVRRELVLSAVPGIRLERNARQDPRGHLRERARFTRRPR